MWVTRPIARAGAVLGVVCLGAAPSGQMTVSFVDALTYYELGEYDAVARGLKASIAGDADRVIPMLARDAEAWIKADGAAEVPRRRMVAATFALELGLSGIDTQWEVTKQAIEWACTMLRRAGPPTELERWLRSLCWKRRSSRRAPDGPSRWRCQRTSATWTSAFPGSLAWPWPAPWTRSSSSGLATSRVGAAG